MEWKSEKKVSCFLCVHVNGKVHVHGYIGNNRNRMNDDHMKRRGRGRKLWTSKNKMINISVINCDLIVLQMIELKRVEREFVVEVFISLISFFRRRCFFFFSTLGLECVLFIKLPRKWRLWAKGQWYSIGSAANKKKIRAKKPRTKNISVSYFSWEKNCLNRNAQKSKSMR